MSELLPCPLCGHLNLKPKHHSHFKCEAPACRSWLELRKGHTQLNDYTARKAADKAKTDAYWSQQAVLKASKTGEDAARVKAELLAKHERNNQAMRDMPRMSKYFTPEFSTTPKPKPYTNNTRPSVAMSTTSEDDTDAPF